MVAIAQIRGHKVIYINNTKGNLKFKWVFADTLKDINEDRPCKRCGCKPTKEGYDACLGYIKNANHACCGHGIDKPYIIYNSD